MGDLRRAAVVKAGRRLAELKHRFSLQFTNDFLDGNGCDILIAAGSLQLCPENLSDWIESLPSRPKHILINKIPLTDGNPFVTVQNIGPALTPYRVFNRAEFASSLTTLGYKIIDEWKNPDLGLLLPFHPALTIDAFSGMYLTTAVPPADERSSS